jgi:hypothetical protein
LAVSISCLFVLCVCVVLLGYTGRDDSHITYFVSEALANGEGLVNYNGDPVEQSSTLAFPVTLSAIVSATGLSAATLGPFVSLAFLCLSVLVATLIVSKTTISQLAPLSVVSVPIVYWGLSGMENSFYLFFLLVLGLLVAIHSKMQMAGNYPSNRALGHEAASAHVPAALEGRDRVSRLLYPTLVSLTAMVLALTRPEFILVITLAVALFALIGLQNLRHHLVLATLILVGAAAGIVLRLLIGLDLFPNPVYAKASDPALSEDFAAGLKYILWTFAQVPSSFICAVAGLIAGVVYCRSQPASAEKTLIKLFLAVSASIFMFAIATGGDWMETGRFVAVPVALAIFAGLASLKTRHALLLAVIFVIAMIADTYRVASLYFGGLPFFNRHSYEAENFDVSPLEANNVIHARDIPFIDRAIPVLKQAAGEDGRVVVASQQAGMVPYYLRREMGERFYFIDLLGLATQHVHACRGAESWGFDPYARLREVESCIDVEFDFLFDLDFEGWPRLKYMEELGCKEVFREFVVIDNVPSWKDERVIPQFLVDCR